MDQIDRLLDFLARHCSVMPAKMAAPLGSAIVPAGAVLPK
jgi:hypothetical protein